MNKGKVVSVGGMISHIERVLIILNREMIQPFFLTMSQHNGGDNFLRYLAKMNSACGVTEKSA